MGREVPEKPLYRGVLPKRGRLGQFPNLRGGGGLAKKREVVLLMGVDTLMSSTASTLSDKSFVYMSFFRKKRLIEI